MAVFSSARFQIQHVAWYLMTPRSGIIRPQSAAEFPSFNAPLGKIWKCMHSTLACARILHVPSSFRTPASMASHLAASDKTRQALRSALAVRVPQERFANWPEPDRLTFRHAPFQWRMQLCVDMYIWPLLGLLGPADSAGSRCGIEICGTAQRSGCPAVRWHYRIYRGRVTTRQK